MAPAPRHPFDQRSLPPGHLSRPVHEDTFSADLPPGLMIEVSEIAPVFGRPGGEIQVRFSNGTKPVPICDLPLASGTSFEGVLR